MVRITEPLEVYNLPLAQKTYSISDIWVVAEAEDVVIGNTSFLFCCKILRQIGDGIAGRLHSARAPGGAGGSSGVNSCGMVHKVGIESGSLDLFLSQVAG